MKKLFFSLFFIIFIFSCARQTNPILDGGDVRKFKVFNMELSDNISIDMKLMSTGTNSVVYADTRLPIVHLIPETNWQSITKEFDKYYSIITSVYGEPTDVDRNKKIILLFHLMPDGLGGYFTSADLIAEENRNNAEVININLAFIINKFDLVQTMDTVFHEFQHLINFNMTFIKNRKLNTLWLNEALSESVYFVYQNGKPNTTRFLYYDKVDTSADSISESISKGNYFVSFDGLESYITASMFMYWLYQHGGGNYILKSIAQGVNNYDYNAVVNAVATSSAFTSPSALGPSPTWDSIFGAWLEANYVNAPSSIKGYKNKYTFTPLQVKGVSSVELKPGGAVYTAGNFSATTSGNLVYKKITKGTTTWTLVYNSSTDEKSLPLTANVANLSLDTSSKEFSLQNDSQLDKRELWVDIVK